MSQPCGVLRRQQHQIEFPVQPRVWRAIGVEAAIAAPSFDEMAKIV
jgi:hypothetical protein